MSKHERGSKRDQILTWWQKVEQRSLELSLEYSHCKITDVSNCYPSIYSHAIAWAIHGREFIKIRDNRENKDLIGNQLDELIRGSREGQTNGIPQASLLAHILAELVLGYCDTGISEACKHIKNLKILRYRDDYRIFGMSDTDCAQALKIVSQELNKFGMKLGSAKTTHETNLIVGAVKQDKLRALRLPPKQKTLQKQLLLIHGFCREHLGSGALKPLLSDFIAQLEQADLPKRLEFENPKVLTAVLMDIGALSPGVFPAVATATSIILSHLSEEERKSLFEGVLAKASRIPNNGYLEIWLQRIAAPNKIAFASSEKMCRLLSEESSTLWNFSWIKEKRLREALENYSIIDRTEFETLSKYIEREEFDAFWTGYN